MLRVLENLRRAVQRRIGGGASLGVGLVILSSGVVVASIPDSGGVINGCYNKSNGNLRIIDTATDSCMNHETAISWSQTGPQGPVGPQGPAGPQGPPGSSQGTVAYSLATFVCGGGHDGGVVDPSLRINNGLITGTFNSPQSSAGCGGTTFRMFQTFTFQNVAGQGNPFAVGTGTATCNPCTVAGQAGTVSFVLTVLGPATVDPSTGLPNGVQSLGGTWTIAGATGGLTGLTGQGIYNSTAANLFTGTIVMPT
jgi:hypothetical protein